MIVKTRYRDISFEEAVRCYRSPGEDITAENWEQFRGKPVEIVTPSTRAYDIRCEGPFFAVNLPVKPCGRRIVVCPHIAEIGD